MSDMKQSAYKEAGVDVDEAAALIGRIKPHVKKTERSGVMSGLGGFGALFDLKATGYKDPILVSGTDGVGTKLKIAIDTDHHNTIGIDAVAMCVNDLVVQGAEPLFFLDYFATGKLVNDVAEKVIAGVAEGCRMAGCALIGGETAEMPGLYMAGDYDIAGFSVGAVERDELVTGERIREGDVILGLASNGLHSNGFSLVRRIIQTSQGVTYDTPCPFEPSLSLGELLLMPTRIYVRAVLKALKIKDSDGAAIHGMAHITGGGFIENIPRVIPDGLCAHIDVGSWHLPKIFRWLRDNGELSHEDLLGTLNCGVGYVIVCSAAQEAEITSALKEEGETVTRIGKIVKDTDNEGPYEKIILNRLNEAWPE
ncbi:MAG: phosphoribosylformylglycinamidine cyclo-ligase [Alphaproteobacteria bacterium]|nr:phosphoribosylformylglycinamidine cyclo-ligase [Alphaproteobacteria bacterium]MCD8520214.1 phosphoribosylformylglycinamidine cyclo-ligase [Alphaproteobacteria bacterium]MCD8526079.1 phosphoribosylformylglycinamidine cyclo-ligase [Alphaproteobacteria bacterium]MCD8570975.1 phosphoribosylformylglycinamidine cyclo-ligase [Alphaproteobacteria bacterium]